MLWTWTDYANAGWAFGHAQNNVALTDNATWQLTGVQLEVGSQATPFESEVIWGRRRTLQTLLCQT